MYSMPFMFTLWSMYIIVQLTPHLSCPTPTLTSNYCTPDDDHPSHQENASKSCLLPLHPHVYADLKRQLKAYSNKIHYHYSRYVNSICKSLEEKEIKAKELCTFLLYLRVFNDEPKYDIKRLEEVRVKLEKAESLRDIFISLNPVTSYIDYNIFELIIQNYGLDTTQDDMKYPEHFRDFVTKHKISELLELSPQLSEKSISSKELDLKFDFDPKSSACKIVELKEAIHEAFNLKEGALRIYSLEEGCVVVKFLISAAVADIIFKEQFTSEQIKLFCKASVIWIKYAGQILFDKNTYGNKISDMLKVSGKGKAPLPPPHTHTHVIEYHTRAC